MECKVPLRRGGGVDRGNREGKKTIKQKVEKGKGSTPTGVQIYKMSAELFEYIRKKI